MVDFVIEHYESASGADALSLDQFSTSPTRFQDLCSFHHCAYNAPRFAIQRSVYRYAVVQGCCNHWDCPRCGIQVARQHYGRIVEGARIVYEAEDMWFITITCRGLEITADEAKANYLSWTSKYLDACYSRCKRARMAWFYVQVTELQRRGHPHSHILTTFHPSDLWVGTVEKWSRNAGGHLQKRLVRALRSDWILSQVGKSGLGDQYDISRVQSVEACSRYIAKYMFKDSQFRADFPKHWKRVRYSQSWPEIERAKTNAFVLLSREDWNRLADLASVVDAEEGAAFEDAEYFLRNQVKVNEVKQRVTESKRKWRSKENETVS